MDQWEDNSEGVDRDDRSEIDVEEADYDGDDYGLTHIQDEDEFMAGIREMDRCGLTDIGSLASWRLSSFKTGCGVEALREDNPDLFWQSEGAQPHHVDLQFSKRVSVQRVSIYTSFGLDESYTPSKISLLAGTGLHDLVEVAALNLNEPHGWIHILLSGMRPDGVIKAFLLRLVVVANHQNGKDTHIRALKVYSPTKKLLPVDEDPIGFNSVAMLSETVIR
jgi:anaphase-promoting complex subunit 10